MTPPAVERVREQPKAPREPGARPPLRPESPSPARTEGIVQAIQAWLDGQL
ncbi:MAG TPA: hypothetical protein VLT82_05370 [Myxococcaceae bacterium]|nr:hypothetical protein [Myxococcaceae bacterium]